MQTTINLKNHLITQTNEFEKILGDAHTKHSFRIDCVQMQNEPRLTSRLDNVIQHQLFKELFAEIKAITSPALYWFEADTPEIATTLRNELDEFRKTSPQKGSEGWRSVPAQNDNQGSSVLYVGVRQGGYTKKHELSNIGGRILIHLGYYKVGTTQGLQLCYWAKHPLTLNVIALNNVDNDYLYILEKLFAIKLKPLCGRH